MPPSEIQLGGEEVGAEFLTWLWHTGENGEETILNGVPVRVQLGQNMKVKAADGSGSEVAIKGEYASTSEELFSALHRGATIHQSRVQLDVNGVVVEGTLKSSTLCLTAVKLPKDPDKDVVPYTEAGEKPGEAKEDDREALENEARLLHRMGLLDRAQDAVDAFFQRFLEQRVSPAYALQRDKMHGWIAQHVKDQAKRAGP